MQALARLSCRLALLSVLAAVALILAACSTMPSTQKQPSLPEAQTPHPTATVSAPTKTPPFYPTARPETSPTRVITLTPSDNVVVKAFQIESGVYDYEHPDLHRNVVKAFWSDDEQLVYYAFLTRIERSLGWAAYDVTTHVTTIISSPLKYDNQVWQHLDVPDPGVSAGVIPELQGYVSPSGKQVIYIIGYGNPFNTPYPSARTEIWVAGSGSHRKTKLSFMPLIGSISNAAWFKDETKIIFDFRYEGAVTDLRIADVQDGTVVSLANVSDFKEGVIDWALSLDDATLAVTKMEGSLWLVFLKDGKSRVIAEFGINPHWSKDGKTLYYVWRPSYSETYTLRSYDIVSGNTSNVVNQSRHTNALAALTSGKFTVSSSGDKILLWGGDLWLVELRK